LWIKDAHGVGRVRGSGGAFARTATVAPPAISLGQRQPLAAYARAGAREESAPADVLWSWEFDAHARARTAGWFDRKGQVGIVRMRRRFLFGVTALLAAALVILPAVAGSEAGPRIEAVNSSGPYSEQIHSWNPAHASVGEGASVTFANPTAIPHGVRWFSVPATPSCSAGVPVGTNETAAGKEWSGTCTFAAAGTYTFYCTVHGSAMTGVITVAANGSVTPVPPSTQPAPGEATTTSGTPGAGEPGAGGASGSPLAGSAASAVKLASSQHGKSVRGSVRVSAAGAHGRLEIDLLARNAALASASRSSRVGVGRLVRSSLLAGTMPFSVALSAKAKGALKRKGHLALTVKLVLKPTAGAAVTVTRSVVMRP
jgi:plastocyanin